MVSRPQSTGGGDGVHCHVITVRGFHCDVYGHVNNARYLEFLEEARWEFVAVFPALAGLADEGLGFVVAAINIEYRRPLGAGEVVEVHSRMVGCDPKRAHMQQRVIRPATGKIVTEAQVSFAVIDLSSGRAVALTGDLRRGLSPAAISGGEL